MENTNEIKSIRRKLAILAQDGIYEFTTDLVNSYEVDGNMSASQVIEILRKLRHQYQARLKDLVPEDPKQQKLF